MERITGREGPLAAGAVGLALVALATTRVHAVRRAVRVGGHSAEASAAGIVFTLSAPGHAPRAGRAWPLVVTSAWRGRALSRASVRVALLQSRRVTARLASAHLFHGLYR